MKSFIIREEEIVCFYTEQASISNQFVGPSRPFPFIVVVACPSATLIGSSPCCRFVLFEGLSWLRKSETWCLSCIPVC